MKMRKKYSKKVIRKVVVLIILFVVLIVDLVYVSFYRDKKNNNAESQSSETIQKGNIKDDEKLLITNLEVYVTPSLGDKDVLLNEELEKHCETKNEKIESAEIFYVTFMEDNENQIIFFARLFPANEIVELVFDYKTDSVSILDCDYTEEQILNEVWEGSRPAIRDIQ